jgi:hypothetical protein
LGLVSGWVLGWQGDEPAVAWPTSMKSFGSS